MDEYHPRATRTLYVGNLSTSSLQLTTSAASGAGLGHGNVPGLAGGAGNPITNGNNNCPPEVYEKFSPFGEILEIDVKPNSGYACVQYTDVVSVVKAIKSCDGQVLNDSSSRVMKLGFARAVPTKCVWCDGVSETVKEKDLYSEFGKFGKVQDIIIHRTRGHALIWFDQVRILLIHIKLIINIFNEKSILSNFRNVLIICLFQTVKAQRAAMEMRGVSIKGGRLQTDYASHECRANFFEQCKKSGINIRQSERVRTWETEEANNQDSTYK